MEQRKMPIKYLWMKEKNIPNTISELDTNMKCKKAGMEDGMPIKSLKAWWRRLTFQTQYPMWNCSWLPCLS